ncbi:hypothetical protein SESBI_25095 [Sesbania bispinosa]|nr:hypothetical protein SESBI_27549 [Sesbania bispinosa]KAJ1406353.1 hypothetical protein SESBI_25095 [Sesbania bispinosa]
MASLKAEKPVEKPSGHVKKEPAAKSSGSTPKAPASKSAPKKTEQKSQSRKKSSSNK